MRAEPAAMEAEFPRPPAVRAAIAHAALNESRAALRVVLAEPIRARCRAT